MSRPRKCNCGSCKLCKNRKYDKQRASNPERRAYKTEYQREYMQRRRADDPALQEYGRQNARAWYHKDGNASISRARDLKRKYGLSPDDVEQRIAEQGGCCALCGMPFDETERLKPVVDHDPRLGNRREAVRGILHQECNRQLGYIERWRARLPEALEYADKAILGVKNTSSETC